MEVSYLVLKKCPASLPFFHFPTLPDTCAPTSDSLGV